MYMVDQVQGRPRSTRCVKHKLLLVCLFARLLADDAAAVAAAAFAVAAAAISVVNIVFR